MRNLILLCTKYLHFSYNSDIYIQTNGVAMDSMLCPEHAVMFMVQLQGTILPALREHITPWKINLDDTISYIKEESVEHFYLY